MNLERNRNVSLERLYYNEAFTSPSKRIFKTMALVYIMIIIILATLNLIRADDEFVNQKFGPKYGRMIEREIKNSTIYPRVKRSQEIVYVEEGDNVEISCEPEINKLDKNKTLYLHWFKNSQPLNNKEPSILIEHASRNMIGTVYRCSLYDEITQQLKLIKDMMIRVQYGPKIIMEPSKIIVGSDEKFDASCLVDAYPIPVVRWFFDTISNDPENPTDIVYESSGLDLNITVIDLKNCRFHNRNLTCEANNTMLSKARGKNASRTAKKMLPVYIKGCENVIFLVTRSGIEKPIPWIWLFLILLILLVLLILLLACLIYVKKRRRVASPSSSKQGQSSPIGTATKKFGSDTDSQTPQSDAAIEEAKLHQQPDKSKISDSSAQHQKGIGSSPIHDRNMKNDKDDSSIRSGSVKSPNSSRSGSPTPSPTNKGRKSLMERLGDFAGNLTGGGVLRPKIEKTPETFMPVLVEMPRLNEDPGGRFRSRTPVSRSSSPFGRFITDDPTSLVHIKKSKEQLHKP